MAKKYKNNKYFNIYQIGGPVSTDYSPSLVERAREKVKIAREAVGQPNAFLDDWNRQRLDTGRFDDQLGNGLIDIQKSNRDSAPTYPDQIPYGFNSYLRATPLIKSKTMTDEEAEIKRVRDAVDYGRRLKQKAINTENSGAQTVVLGEYNPKAHTIYHDPKSGESNLLHEQAHASKATPQENKISEIFGTKNTFGTDYYDRPTEIYSRLMQFRQANNLDPTEIITKERLKGLKKSAIDFNLLNRYKDDQLLQLFNDVAYVDTPLNNDVNFAAYGGKVNRFDGGGIFNKFANWSNKVGDKWTGENTFLGKMGVTSGNMGGIANTIGSTVTGLLNPNGNSTGVGNVMQTIGGLASNIPGVGGLIGAGVGMLGGLVNTAFGSKINEENVAQFRAQNQQQANYTSNASTNEELLADFGSMQHLGNVARKDVGSDGWFSNKAKKLTRDINAERQRANLAAITSLGNTAQTVDTTNDLLKGYNFSAYGGPINMKYTGIMSPFGNQFKDGGIYIKPENRGKFTALKERTGKSATWFKEYGTPAQKKMATFALNSRKWRHDEGGPLFNYNDLKKDDYGLLTYNGTPVLSSKDSSRRTSEDKSTRRDTPLGYLVGDENQNTANLIWGGMELLPVVGNVMGIADVANDVYNMANSDNISSGDFGNLLLDIGGLVPGISTFTKASKLAKAAKLRKAASKLDNAAESLKYTSSDGIKEIKKRVKDAKDFSKKSSEEATKAALSRNKEDLYKAAMKSREAAKFNEGILEGVDKALDPFWTRYNVYQNVGTKADALNDIFGFMGSIEDNTKAFGGELTHGGIFSNGTSIIGNGGTHEENPYDGIQVGVDEQGIPNLVEQDELIWNDYVFSNRLKVPKAVKQKYKLRNTKDLKFAEAAKQLQKESEERPNDPISKNGLNAALSDLANEQEYIRMKKEQKQNTFAKGGKLGNLYEGEGPKSNFLQFKKKSYPNLFTIPDFSQYAIKDPFKIPQPRYTTPDFSVSLLEPNASSLEGYMSYMFEPISKDIFNTKVTKTKESSNDTRKFREDPLRYAPIVGHAAGVSSDIFSKPDYQAANEVRNIELNPSLVGFTPIGNKLKFTPYDINFQINKANASAGASRRNIMNTSGGNRAAAMAGLMGVDTNYYNALGDAYRQALQYNDARREAVETFNRATDQYNSEMGLKASMANAESRNAMSRARYERDKIAALLGQQARDAYNTRRSNNLNILLEDLGNLGKERNSRNWADILASRGVIKMNSKGEHQSKNGGKLNRKKKGGWEYA